LGEVYHVLLDLFGLWTRLEMGAGDGMTVFIPKVPLSSSGFRRLCEV
jgi:hypothetical protein